MAGSTRPRGRKGGKAPVDWAGKTTVMIRNIPSVYSQKDLIAEVSRRGFAGSFDFFYLPMDFAKSANAGYAFANFVDVASVSALRKEFDGKRLELAPTSTKLIQVVPATLQGYDANFAHFAHSAVLNHHKTEHSPVFLRDGKTVTPTRSAKKRDQPRMPRARTLAVEPVPPAYTHAMLFLELGSAFGAGPSIEALHLPVGPDGSHLGTAYVVFKTEQAAQQFLPVLDGAAFTLAPGAPVMRVSAELPRASRKPGPLLPAPRPTRFEYTTGAAELPLPVAVPEAPDLDAVSWEAFADPSTPFEPEVLAAYAAMLNAYSVLPATAPAPPAAWMTEVVPESDAAWRGLQVPERFQGLGIDVGDDDKELSRTPGRRAWTADLAETPGTAPRTAAFDTNSLLPAPTPPASWTPQRARATSAPIRPSSSTAPGAPKPAGKGKEGKSNSPHRTAITPPTTTAGSSRASTPRDGHSLSPEHGPAGEEPAASLFEHSPFDLPSLLPSPSALLSLKVPPAFPDVGQQPFQPHSRT